jgi:cytidine deaminase
MVNVTDAQLIRRAKSVARKRKVTPDFQYGSVGCALVSEKGRVYVGCCIDAISGMGFCAEHAAIAAMLVAGDRHIQKIVAVANDGVILSPCGRCREFMYQVNGNKGDAVVIVGKNEAVSLEQLLPMPWQKSWERLRRQAERIKNLGR